MYGRIESPKPQVGCQNPERVPKRGRAHGLKTPTVRTGIEVKATTLLTGDRVLILVRVVLWRTDRMKKTYYSAMFRHNVKDDNNLKSGRR